MPIKKNVVMVLAGLTFLFLGNFAVGKNFSSVAVVVVDVQSDFTELKHGSLAIEGTDENYLKLVIKNTKELKNAGFPIYATQDWHPSNHVSFYSNHPGKKEFDVITANGIKQMLWPPHAVQNTSGAEILIDNSLFTAIVKKGTDAKFDSYSGFKDASGKETNLDKLLKEKNIKTIVVYGLATDFCVKATALDAISNGYKVILLPGLSRGTTPESTAQAIAQMKSKGVIIADERVGTKTDILSFLDKK